jgi:CO/xanthine dehydrogenase Mo-binding subunit
VGGALPARAPRQLRDEVVRVCGEFPRNAKTRRAAARRVCADAPERRFEARYEKPREIEWDDATYRGDAYGVYSYGAAVAELEVDKVTYEVRLRRVSLADDVGRAINPLLVEGQVIGGTVQAIGWALYENTVYKDGRMHNAQLTNYIIPTSLDTPPMEVDIVEQAYSHGPGGAKGIGELPMDVPAPAIAAAVHQATGLLIADLPILPESILRASADAKADRQR